MITGVQQLFDDEYEKTLETLTKRAQSAEFSLETVEQELSYLQVYEGHDWSGRGELKQAEISAQILAYQVFLKRYSKR